VSARRDSALHPGHDRRPGIACPGRTHDCCITGVVRGNVREFDLRWRCRTLGFDCRANESTIVGIPNFDGNGNLSIGQLFRGDDRCRQGRRRWSKFSVRMNQIEKLPGEKHGPFSTVPTRTRLRLVPTGRDVWVQFPTAKSLILPHHADTAEQDGHSQWNREAGTGSGRRRDCCLILAVRCRLGVSVTCRRSRRRIRRFH